MNLISKTATHKVQSAGTLYVTTKADIEREWRDSELSRTDKLVLLPDYPRVHTQQQFLDYRETVAKWDSNPDFPDSSKRPKWTE
jgi:hypothetical protein